MQRWQHEETGQVIECNHRPTHRYYPVPEGYGCIKGSLDETCKKMMNQTKENCLSQPYTNERSITVDQIDCVLDAMHRDGLSFPEAVRVLGI